MNLKLLVCGDVKGKLDELYKKVALIEKKSGKFDSLFCVGDFFSTESDFITNYIEHKKSSPIETFIISPLPDCLREKIDEKGSQICTNITYLGDKGVLKFTNKLNIAFVSTENIAQKDVKDLSNQLMCTNLGYTGIDILLTCQWPAGIELGSTDLLPNNHNSQEFGNELISALTTLVQPRYHFTAGQAMFYERQPYKNQKNNLTKQKHVTRFIALSSFNNKNKDKFLYALQLNPMELMTQEELCKLPVNCTDNPFAAVNTDNILSSAKQQFFYEIPDKKRMADTKKTDNEKKRRNDTSDGCWFCLGNPEVEKHLLVHIGEEAYIAMPRGSISDEHMMILSVGHFNSLVSCPKVVYKEIKKLMKIISKYFSSKGKSTVFYERNFKNQHFQLQVIPIANDKLEICKNKFLEMAECSGPGKDFIEIPRRTKLEEIVKPHVPYFYLEFSDGSKFFGIIPRSQYSFFHLQFGRLVLCDAEILNCPDKIEWKYCTENRHVEEQLVKKLKNSLAKVF